MGDDNMGRTIEELFQIAGNFAVNGKMEEISPHGSGHINDTFLITYRENGKQKRYILQRMNHEIFKDLSGLMENVVHVTEFLREKIIKSGGEPERETLNVIRTKDGAAYWGSKEDGYWRMYRYVEGATSYDAVEKPEDFYESAVAFWQLQKKFADFTAENIH